MLRINPDGEHYRILQWAPSYAVSTHGNVVRTVSRKGAKAGHVLSPASWGTGYHHVNLSYGGKKHVHTIHRLVAMTFIPTQNCKLFVNHKNGIKTDNRVDNLEWVTNQENMLLAYATGQVRPHAGKRGSNNPKAKLTETIVKSIVADWRTNRISQSDLARRYNVSTTAIFNVVRGNCWGWATGISP